MTLNVVITIADVKNDASHIVNAVASLLAKVAVEMKMTPQPFDAHYIVSDESSGLTASALTDTGKLTPDERQRNLDNWPTRT